MFRPNSGHLFEIIGQPFQKAETAQTFTKVVLIFSSNPAISIIFLAGYSSAKLHPHNLPIKLQQKSARLQSRNTAFSYVAHLGHFSARLRNSYAIEFRRARARALILHHYHCNKCCVTQETEIIQVRMLGLLKSFFGGPKNWHRSQIEKCRSSLLENFIIFHQQARFFHDAKINDFLFGTKPLCERLFARNQKCNYQIPASD